MREQKVKVEVEFEEKVYKKYKKTVSLPVYVESTEGEDMFSHDYVIKVTQDQVIKVEEYRGSKEDIGYAKIEIYPSSDTTIAHYLNMENWYFPTTKRRFDKAFNRAMKILNEVK